MSTHHPIYSSYDEMLADPLWQDKLRSLNYCLKDSLQEQNAPAVLSGNLFYDHLQENFWDAELLPGCNMKRRRLFALASKAKSFFEVGVNGGHSMFLALSANPNLLCTGVDLCQQLSPKWGPVHIYVEAGVKWLQQNFPDHLTFIKGDCLVVVPEFVKAHPEQRIDLAHIDGAKHNYLHDLKNLWPLFHSGTKLIIDDTDIPLCREMVEMIIKSGKAIIDADYADTISEKYQNTVLSVV